MSQSSGGIAEGPLLLMPVALDLGALTPITETKATPAIDSSVVLVRLGRDRGHNKARLDW